jgi:hypothetical protein
MAFSLSPLSDNDSAIPVPKISLAGPAHVKMSRIWMFAMLKDWPTLTERAHIAACEPCESAFKAAIGVSSFGKGSKEQQPQGTEPPSRPAKDVPKAVA